MNSKFEKYDGLIFDCDGTLIDSMPVHYVAWKATMLKYGIHFSEARFYALGGVPVFEIIKTLAEDAGKELDIEAVADEKEKMFIANMHEAQAIDEVVAIARANLGKKPMAVASGTAGWALELELKHIGIYDWFDAIVGSDTVKKHKPEPDVFLEAARQISVEPARCCAFEDSDMGIQAAQAAGMDVVDVRELRKG
ncbi:MAG: beta-phosphoglucomutase family hydrolase [Calditrichaeota bacterium]|nr:MAG: beta-phosphoglucomutase family hydrolase [Calditrichota bacterium]